MIRADELISRLPKRRKVIGAEIGVWKGEMSAYLLERMRNLHLILVDRWEPPTPDDPFFNTDKIARASRKEHDAAFKEAMEAVAPYMDRVTVFRGELSEMARNVDANLLDFAFFDGDHSYPGMVKALREWYRRVKVHGLYCGHDYYGGPEIWTPNRPKRGVGKAVHEVFGGAPELGGDFTWFVKRTARMK